MSAGTSPQTPLGELTALPQAPCFKGGRFAVGGEWREGEGLGEGKRERAVKGGMGKGGEKGSWEGEISHWLLGDRRPCSLLSLVSIII